MKTTLQWLALLLFIALVGYAHGQADSRPTASNTPFTIVCDTMEINTDAYMTHAFKYNDKFYVLFRERNSPRDSIKKQWLSVFSQGQVEQMIAMPEDMSFPSYYDCVFYVYKDEFILHPYRENNLYYFDIQTNKWRRTDPNSYRLYEYADDRFEIYANSFGEWGSVTWFLDKKTDRYGTKTALQAKPKISSYGDYDDLIGISREFQDKSYGYAEYAVNFGPALVNKIGTTYYFTRANRILKIENPLSLYECSVDQMYENYKANSNQRLCCDTIGYEVIYNDARWRWYSRNNPSFLLTSFVYQNELYSLYQEYDTTFLVTTKHNDLQKIQPVCQKCTFLDSKLYGDEPCCKNMNGQNELLLFWPENNTYYGLMEIVGNQIRMHYIQKQD